MTTTAAMPMYYVVVLHTSAFSTSLWRRAALVSTMPVVCSIFQIDLLCRGANPNGLDILALRQLSKQAISDHFQAGGINGSNFQEHSNI